MSPLLERSSSRFFDGDRIVLGFVLGTLGGHGVVLGDEGVVLGREGADRVAEFGELGLERLDSLLQNLDGSVASSGPQNAV